MTGAGAGNVLGSSLIETAERIRSREVSAQDLTAASLARAEALQPDINAFIRIDTEAAMLAAERADGEIAAGRYRSVLHGIPLAHKDMFYRAGEITSCGSDIRRDFRAEFTSNLIARLDAAGAISIGWLNLSEFAGGPTGHNVHFGDCRNPWNTAHVSGGSSSGSGAAVAAGIVFGALGSDTGGSVRIPAACCGVVGVKPTYGLVSRHGAMPRSWSLDHIGPLTRRVADSAAILQAIAGVNAGDATSWFSDVPDYVDGLGAVPKGIRIGVPKRGFVEDAAPDVIAAFEAALEVLCGLGCVRVDVDLPDPNGLSKLNDVISKSEAATIHRKWLTDTPERYGDHVRSRIEAGLAIPATRYLEALSVRTGITQRFVDSVFSKCDVVCAPTLPFSAPRRDESNPEEPTGVLDLVRKMTYRTRLFNFLGLPAFSIPMGFDARHLPLGLQMIGPPLGEAGLFGLAQLYERETPWHTMKPPVG